MSDPLRFWSKVQLADEDSCWLWTGATNNKGYGTAWWNDDWILAHRLAWELTNGPIPFGLVRGLQTKVLHECDNPPCANPRHLKLGSQAENMADAAARDRVEKGSQRYNARLSEADIPEIRRLVAAGISQRKIARRFGVSRGAIQRIVEGTGWTSV